MITAWAKEQRDETSTQTVDNSSYSPELERLLQKSRERLDVAEQKRQHQERLREEARIREAAKPFAFD